MTEIAVTKQPKKKFGYETTEITGTKRQGYEMTGSPSNNRVFLNIDNQLYSLNTFTADSKLP